MKISIGTKIKEGPWGGGNLFAINLKDYLVKNGHQVVNNLEDSNIDIILITEPRRTSESSAYTHIDVENYLKYVNNSALVIHRINECDERKNTNYVNKYLIRANSIADYTVFVSEWLKNLYIDQGLNKRNNFVVPAGANKKIFNSINYKPWSKSEKLKIVTHHWGANWNKGFNIYQKLDEMIALSEYKDLISFTYIGNLPKNFTFKNSNVISPLAGEELSNEIKKHHVYLTASINEPSGNHHIEGAQCGLPLLFINSGGIPEYCQGYGVQFENYNFEDSLKELIQNYNIHLENNINYPFSAEKMSKEYEELIFEMIENKEELLKKRIFTNKKTKLGAYAYNLKRNIRGLV